MKRRELLNLGVPKGDAIKTAFTCLRDAGESGKTRAQLASIVKALVQDPSRFLADPHFAPLAKALLEGKEERDPLAPRESPAPYKKWGKDLDEKSIAQMDNACKLPISVSGALMPDAHMGYGLPIGGVLATRNAIIPYAVGMDIACRMKLSVLDLPVTAIRGQEDKLRNAIETATRFGLGASFKNPKSHAVLDEDWSVSPITKRDKDKAWKQLGTSGSGNHFVEFGALTLDRPELGLKPGVYVALLSHSGSRGTGGNVATHYSKLAMAEHKRLPRELLHLAWLDLESELGQEYWNAMQLMGRYAAANHALIHRDIAKFLRVRVLAEVENHHNFAWKEVHDGEQVVVHRKGATPADKGALGVIPGSMGTPGFVVRGLGKAESLNSAAHGAGRVMSRNAAKSTFRWNDARKFLKERDVVLISAGLDEVPMSYKNIHEVMAAQQDLVEIVARFDPRLVKMAPGKERGED